MGQPGTGQIKVNQTMSCRNVIALAAPVITVAAVDVINVNCMLIVRMHGLVPETITVEITLTLLERSVANS